jgi:hypothetical protein
MADIQDYEDYGEVNKQLEKMGYNIGTRLIEDFLARTGMGRCQTFAETAEVISKVCLPNHGTNPKLMVLGCVQDFPQYHTDNIISTTLI